MQKMRVLTFVQIAEGKSELSFDTIEKELQLEPDDVEAFIIDGELFTLPGRGRTLPGRGRIGPIRLLTRWRYRKRQPEADFSFVLCFLWSLDHSYVWFCPPYLHLATSER